MMEVIRSSETSFLKEPHNVTSQKKAFFIVTAVKNDMLRTAKLLNSNENNSLLVEGRNMVY
jgi:hypothetical protein